MIPGCDERRIRIIAEKEENESNPRAHNQYASVYDYYIADLYACEIWDTKAEYKKQVS